jgi:hypothetical protein
MQLGGGCYGRFGWHTLRRQRHPPDCRLKIRGWGVRTRIQPVRARNIGPIPHDW